MKALIDRQAAIDEIRRCRFVVDAIEKINGLPSSQSEIICCKECKHFNGYFVECDHESGLRHIKDDNDYCSYAERRTNEHID